MQDELCRVERLVEEDRPKLPGGRKQEPYPAGSHRGDVPAAEAERLERDGKVKILARYGRGYSAPLPGPADRKPEPGQVGYEAPSDSSPATPSTSIDVDDDGAGS